MGKKTLNENEYLFASVRVRSEENRLIGREQLMSAASSPSRTEIEGLISSLSDKGGSDEEKLSFFLSSVYDFASEICPDKALLLFLRYVYDCNNIKSAIKCYFRGSECREGEMLFPFGSVPSQKIREMPESRDFSLLPAHMKEAAEAAMESFARTGNPQNVDTLLDSACFCDMLRAAEDCGEGFASELVRERIDLTNIMMTVRTMRMGGANSERLLHLSLIDGGNIEKEGFLSSHDENELCTLIRRTKYLTLIPLIAENAPLYKLECLSDNIFMESVREVRRIPFGAPLIIAYIIAAEYQVKNLRIILAGKRASLAPETILSRVRLGYV
ncbi:MAG: V-type ATPase subunit [Clostridia bacterium]|nr:V-type ATPase subunit [Clostridia bacterium]